MSRLLERPNVIDTIRNPADENVAWSTGLLS